MFCSKYTGDFHLLEQEGELTTCNEAAVFTNDKGKLFIYRLNEGDWVVGTQFLLHRAGHEVNVYL